MKNQIKCLSCFMMGILLMACGSNNNKSNVIKVTPGDDLKEIVRKSTHVVPTKSQYQWQQLEFIAFLHFGPNTFSQVEWGTGKEDPKIFNPTDFDANQWISVIKDAGMKMAMLTAKHHDGFCLWPTNTTAHSVKSSPWKNGHGDVLGEVASAAKKENIKIGVYLSPADLHEIERKNGTYGNGSVPKMVKIPSNKKLQESAPKVFEYLLDDYDALFMNQLYEVLTQYGKIEEVWFDGANPKPGTGQKYNRKAWYDMIRQLQPQAVIAIKGPDVRWCGNEAGHTRKNEWSVVPVPEDPNVYNWRDVTMEDIGSRNKLKDAKYLYWYPAETNTSIRRGWFYRDDKQYVKTVEELVDTWYRSVGGNTVFLLNLTPNRKGLIPDKDAARLRKLGGIISNTFKENLAEDATVVSSQESNGHSGSNMLDGNMETCWKPQDGSEQANFVVNLSHMKMFNRLMLQECIKSYGQRIEQFAVDVWKNDGWQQITQGTVVGYKNIRRFPMVKTKKIRIRILASRVAPTLSVLGVYKAPEMLSNPFIERSKSGQVVIRCKTPDPQIYYTLDGSEPSSDSRLYTQPFSMSQGGVVKAVAVVQEGHSKSEVVEQRFDLCSARWKVRSTSSAQKGYDGSLAIDGKTSTMWHTPWNKEAIGHPHSIDIDLGEKLHLKGVSYTPRMDGRLGGICKKYRVFTSLDGVKWTLAKQGAFNNIKNNPVLQRIVFKRVMVARYIKFVSLSNVNNDAYLSVAELGVITK